MFNAWTNGRPINVYDSGKKNCLTRHWEPTLLAVDLTIDYYLSTSCHRKTLDQEGAIGYSPEGYQLCS